MKRCGNWERRSHAFPPHYTSKTYWIKSWVQLMVDHVNHLIVETSFVVDRHRYSLGQYFLAVASSQDRIELVTLGEAISVIFGCQGHNGFAIVREMKYTSQHSCDRTIDDRITFITNTETVRTWRKACSEMVLICCYPNCSKSWWLKLLSEVLWGNCPNHPLDPTCSRPLASISVWATGWLTRLLAVNHYTRGANQSETKSNISYCLTAKSHITKITPLSLNTAS